jgi:hypothetical protein
VTQFEERVREGQPIGPKFFFLSPADSYHGYYQHKMEKVVQGGDDVEQHTKIIQPNKEMPEQLKRSQMRDGRPCIPPGMFSKPCISES